MKPGPVTKLGKRNKKPSKKIDNDVMSANCDVIIIFRFIFNLGQSESRIPDAKSVKVTFSKLVTFYLAKTENRTKNLKHSSHTLLL